MSKYCYVTHCCIAIFASLRWLNNKVNNNDGNGTQPNKIFKIFEKHWDNDYPIALLLSMVLMIYCLERNSLFGDTENTKVQVHATNNWK